MGTGVGILGCAIYDDETVEVICENYQTLSLLLPSPSIYPLIFGARRESFDCFLRQKGDSEYTPPYCLGKSTKGGGVKVVKGSDKNAQEFKAISISEQNS